jgi:hypothetical protein
VGFGANVGVRAAVGVGVLVGVGVAVGTEVGDDTSVGVEVGIVVGVGVAVSVETAATVATRVLVGAEDVGVTVGTVVPAHAARRTINVALMAAPAILTFFICSHYRFEVVVRPSFTFLVFLDVAPLVKSRICRHAWLEPMIGVL